MDTPSDIEAESLVSKVISTWRSGHHPNACDVLQRHPDLRQRHSLVLDLAYEEYCLRREAGEQVALSTYCELFPTVRKSLRVLLAADECTEDDPDFADSMVEIRWPEVESQFMGFRLVREIGRGAFARVYLATEPSLGDRLVVVKVSRAGGGEAETLGRLRHRNIVPVYSVQEDDSSRVTAVCMPYLGRSTLLSVLDAASAQDAHPEQARMIHEVAQQDAILDAIPAVYTEADPYLMRAAFVDGIVHIMVQLADALAHAHQSGICHRDLKPSNVLLAPSGCPLLLDFNLSSDIRLQRTLVGGTLPYMPPEQLRTVILQDAEEEDLGDPRSDVFSLGVMLYELLTRRLPFGDQVPDDEASVSAFRILARQEEGCPTLESMRPDIDPQLAALVAKCLQLESADRPQSARDLAALLCACASPSARLKRWARRRRFLIASSAGGLAVLASTMGIGLALQPPYAVRRYGAGIKAFEEGNLERAAACFSDAHQAEPDAYEPLFARGQVLVTLARYEDATDDLEEVYSRAPDGLTAAWAAYSHQLKGRSVKLQYFYELALGEHDYRTPAVLNNLASDLRDRGVYSRADNYLTEALHLDPKCQSAYLNRADVYANCAPETAPDGRSYRQMAIEDVERAIALKPNNGRAHFMAAMFHFLHGQESDKEKTALSHLRLALDYGFDKKTILTSGFPSEISQQLLDYPTVTSSVSGPSLLIPLPYCFPAFTPPT